MNEYGKEKQRQQQKKNPLIQSTIIIGSRLIIWHDLGKTHLFRNSFKY